MGACLSAGTGKGPAPQQDSNTKPIDTSGVLLQLPIAPSVPPQHSTEPYAASPLPTIPTSSPELNVKHIPEPASAISSAPDSSAFARPSTHSTDHPIVSEPELLPPSDGLDLIVATDHEPKATRVRWQDQASTKEPAQPFPSRPQRHSVEQPTVQPLEPDSALQDEPAASQPDTATHPDTVGEVRVRRAVQRSKSSARIVVQPSRFSIEAWSHDEVFAAIEDPGPGQTAAPAPKRRVKRAATERSLHQRAVLSAQHQQLLTNASQFGWPGM